jgi:hypothetical protein
MSDVNFQKVSRQLRKVISPKDGTYKFLSSEDPQDVTMGQARPGDDNAAARADHVHHLDGAEEQQEEQESILSDLQKIYTLLSEATEIYISDEDAISEIGELDISATRLSIRKTTMLIERIVE